MKDQLTAVVLTKNEEAKVVGCLESLQWCDRILVVDDGSKDRTVEMAGRYKARVVKHALNGDYAGQRNWALKQVKTEWVLFVDADEQASSDLAAEIQTVIKQNDKVGYRVKRQEIFFGKRLRFGETSKWNEVRLAKTGVGEWHRKVHEVWEIDGPVGQLRYRLVHTSHQRMADFWAKINNYSTLSAQYKFEKGERSAWWQIILYPLGKFMQNYFGRLGFLDGTHGFVLATCMSFHSFLVRGKLYLLQRKK